MSLSQEEFFIKKCHGVLGETNVQPGVNIVDITEPVKKSFRDIITRKNPTIKLGEIMIVADENSVSADGSKKFSGMIVDSSSKKQKTYGFTYDNGKLVLADYTYAYDYGSHGMHFADFDMLSEPKKDSIVLKELSDKNFRVTEWVCDENGARNLGQVFGDNPNLPEDKRKELTEYERVAGKLKTLYEKTKAKEPIAKQEGSSELAEEQSGMQPE